MERFRAEYLRLTAARVWCCLCAVVWLACGMTRAEEPLHFTPTPLADWAGEPCLMTNVPGAVCLVFNPNRYTANPAYRNKTDALALLASAGTIPAGDAFAPVGDAMKIAAGDKLAAAQVQSSAPASLEMAQPASTTGNPKDRPASGKFHANYFTPAREAALCRWLLFALITVWLCRRVFRFFRQTDDDDDYADHLSSLAVAHRWTFAVYLLLMLAAVALEFFQVGNLFFSLSILLLAAAVRGYYCESHFSENPRLKLLHFVLVLCLALLAWTLSGYGHLSVPLSWWRDGQLIGGVKLWLALAFGAYAFQRIVSSRDLQSNLLALQMILWSYVLIFAAGAGVGAVVGNQIGVNPKLAALFGAFFSVLLLTVYFITSKNPVFAEAMGGFVVDLFLPDFFGDKVRRKRRLPDVALLRHWRQHGNVEAAWQAARGNLAAETRALPLWLFALETAVLYRRKPDEARAILNDLCGRDEFSASHRMAVVGQVQGWMAAAGFKFDAAQFKVRETPLKPGTLSDKVEAFCREGRFGEAAQLLRETLREDSLNENAFFQLVRLYAQDLKNRPAAERLIAEAEETFSPKLLEFMRRSLDEWMSLPIRSTQKKRGRLARWFGGSEPKPAAEKISLLKPGVAPAPAKGKRDPLEIHIERLQKNEAKHRPQTAHITDPVEKLLVERKFGSALELLQEQAEAAPADFKVWLRMAEVHGHHCGQLSAAEKIIRQMDHSGNFRKSEMRKAYTRLQKWHEKHRPRRAG